MLVYLHRKHLLDTRKSFEYNYIMPPTKATLPTHESPIKALRGDLRQESFAYQVGISRIALLRFEQGTIPSPSLKFQKHLPQSLPWEAFVEDYYAYQTAKRIANYGILDPATLFHVTTQHPMKEWLENSRADTITTVCVALCIHLPIMDRFVRGPHPTVPPDNVLDALEEAGYSKSLISDFLTAYITWRSKHGTWSGLRGRPDNGPLR